MITPEIMDAICYDRHAPAWTYNNKLYFTKEDLISELGSYEAYYEMIEDGTIEFAMYPGLDFIEVESEEEAEK